MAKYRGYYITQEYDLNYYSFDAEGYDADWDGEKYVQCSGMPSHSGATVDDVKAEIDGYYNELAMDICFEACGIAHPEFMKFYGLAA